jgi:hypothetical protein
VAKDFKRYEVGEIAIESQALKKPVKGKKFF